MARQRLPYSVSTSAAEVSISGASADFGKHALYLDWGCGWCSSGAIANVALLPRKRVNASTIHATVASILDEHGNCEHLEEVAQMWADSWSSK